MESGKGLFSFNFEPKQELNEEEINSLVAFVEGIQQKRHCNAYDAVVCVCRERGKAAYFNRVLNAYNDKHSVRIADLPNQGKLFA
jgi:CMP-2-keto-3-deoxyoctulosonic acid synthetase